MRGSLSVIIPTYNEANRILPTLEDYYSFLSKKLAHSFEIIIVPNNCSDGTLFLVKRFAKGKKNIRIFNILQYSGKGGAVLKGFTIAKSDYIGFTDADGSTDAQNFYKLYQNINGFDGIIASRRLKESVIIKRNQFERFSSCAFNLLVNLLFNLGFKDTQCGAKLFTKKTTRIILKNYLETGWIFDVDILYICKKKNLKIEEIPIKWVGKSESKLGFNSKINSLFQLIKYRFK